MKYLVALNNKAYDDPTAITTVATPPGTVGPVNVWTDITARVKRHEIERGRQRSLGRFEPGRCQIEADNNDGALNPWNTSSPYASISPPQGTPFQVVANGTPRFTGMLESVRPRWSDNFTSVVEMRSSDALALLALADVVDPQQMIIEGGTGLTSFTLSYPGTPGAAGTTGSLSAATTASAIESALRALPAFTPATGPPPGPPMVVVTGPSGVSHGPWRIFFTGALVGTQVPLFNSTATGGTGTVTVSKITTATSSAYASAVLADNPQNYWRLGDPPLASPPPTPTSVSTAVDSTSGTAAPGIYSGAQQLISPGGSGLTTYTLTYPGTPGPAGTTVPIAGSATAATVQSAIQGLPAFGAGSVSVGGPGGGPWNVMFIGPLFGISVPLFSATPSGGTGTVTVTSLAPGIQGAPGALATDTAALAFDAQNLGLVGIPGPLALPGGTTFTVEFFMKLHSAPPPAGSTQPRVFVASSAAGSVTVGVSSIDHAGASLTAPNAAVNISIGSAGGGFQFFSATLGVADGNWHHIAVVCTNTLTASYLCYHNGSFVAMIVENPTGQAPWAFTPGATAPAVIAGFAPTAPSPLFNGVVEELALYQQALSGARVAAHYLASLTTPKANAATSVWPEQFSGERIADILRGLGWPSGAASIATGDIRVQATANLGTTKALSHLQACELTEDGAFFVDATGVIRFINHNALAAAPFITSQATFTDLPASGSLYYQPGSDIAADDQDLYNKAAVGNVGQPVQYAADGVSVLRYGARIFPGTTELLGTDQIVAATRATAIVARFKDPVTRIRRIDLAPIDDTVHLGPEVIARDLLQCVTVERKGGPGGPLDPVIAHRGAAISIKANVEKIRDTMTSDGDSSAAVWSVSYGLSSAFLSGA